VNIFERNREDIAKDNPLALSAIRLLQFESEIRELRNKSELYFHLAHDLSAIAPFDCSMLFVRNIVGTFKLELVKNIPDADGSSELVQKIHAWLASDKNVQDKDVLKLSLKEDINFENEKYPFNNILWVPIISAGELNVGLLLFRKKEFTDKHLSLLQRLSKTYGHALGALQPKKSSFFKGKLINTIPAKIILVSGFCVSLFIPIPYSVLASVEVVPDDPFVVTAPFDGVINTIEVETNSIVTKGDLLIQFDDLRARNEKNLAYQRLEVANAKLENITALAFDHIDAGYDQAIAYTEYGLAQLEAAYADEMLAKTQAISAVDGVAIYTDKNDWEGKSIKMGEQILKVADPKKVKYHIELPVSDVIAIKKGTPVTVYLDSSPLGGHTAILDSISYKPALTASGVMAYTLVAMPEEGDNPRIGSRGTARIYSGTSPLIWQLVRRPLQFVRQRLGL
tara:strand:+ start:1429 stop:2787 length:1359 start_codon:yes stop_codon:yes gene_type:complete